MHWLWQLDICSTLTSSCGCWLSSQLASWPCWWGITTRTCVQLGESVYTHHYGGHDKAWQISINVTSIYTLRPSLDTRSRELWAAVPRTIQCSYTVWSGVSMHLVAIWNSEMTKVACIHLLAITSQLETSSWDDWESPGGQFMSFQCWQKTIHCITLSMRSVKQTHSLSPAMAACSISSCLWASVSSLSTSITPSLPTPSLFTPSLLTPSHLFLLWPWSTFSTLPCWVGDDLLKGVCLGIGSRVTFEDGGCLSLWSLPPLIAGELKVTWSRLQKSCHYIQQKIWQT